MNKLLTTLSRMLLLAGIGLFLLLAILRFPAVQTFIVDKVLNNLESRLNSKLAIERVNYNLLDELSLKGVYIEDQQRDTLIYLGNIQVNIALFQLFNKELNFENITLNEANIYLEQYVDSTYNFSFIIDSLSQKDESPSSTFDWKIALEELQFGNLNLNINLLSNSHEFNIGALDVSLRSMDLQQQEFHVEHIGLGNTQIINEFKQNTSSADSSAESSFSFPLEKLKLLVSCDEISLHHVDYELRMDGAKETTYFSPSNFSIAEADMLLSNIYVSDSLLSFSLDSADCKLDDKQGINDLNLTAYWQSDTIFVQADPWYFNESRMDFKVNSAFSSLDAILNLDSINYFNFTSDSTQIYIKDIGYFAPQLLSDNVDTNFYSESLMLDAYIEGKNNILNIEHFNFHVMDSKLSLVGGVELSNKLNQIQLFEFNGDVESSSIDLRKVLGEDLIKPNYDYFGKIQSDFQLNGTLDSLLVDKFSLKTAASLEANFKGKLARLTSPKELMFDLHSIDLKTSYSAVQHLDISLPELLSSVRTLSYTGVAKGDLHRYEADGKFSSNLGEILIDANLNFNELYDDANYLGEIEFKRFQLGELLKNEQLGELSLFASIDGRGLSLNTLHADANVMVSDIAYNNYSYKNINLDGRFDEKQFEGNLDVKDENLVFQFDGLVNLQDSLTHFDFNAALEKLDAQALNFTKLPLKAKLDITANFTGSNMDNVNGRLAVRNISIQNEEKSWSSDSLVVLVPKNTSNEKDIQITSSFLNVDVNGNYSLENIPKALIAFGDQHFPFSALIAPYVKSDQFSSETMQELNDEFYELDISLYHIDDILKVFNVDFEQPDSLSLYMKLDAPNKLLDFDLSIPAFRYKNIFSKDISLIADTKSDDLRVNFRVDSMSYGEDFYIPGLGFDGVFKDKQAQLSTYIQAAEDSFSLQLDGKIHEESNGIVGEFLSPVYLYEKPWNITQSKNFKWQNNSIDIPNIKLSSGKQIIEFKTDDSMRILFSDFELATITNLVQKDSLDIEGLINGQITFDESLNLGLMSSEMYLDSLRINNRDIGKLSLKANKMDESIQGKLVLSGYANEVNGSFTYEQQSKEIDAAVAVDKLVLSHFEPLVNTYVSQLKGSINGRVELKGLISDPDLAGNLSFTDVSMIVQELGTEYGVKSGGIQLSKEALIPELELTDYQQNKALLSGTVAHDFFTDFRFDLTLKSSKFALLNSKENPESLFFGRFLGSMDFKILGNLTTPSIKGKLGVLEQSDLTIQLLSKRATADQETYVIFVDGGDYDKESIDSIAAYRYHVESNIDLDLDVSIDKKAVLNIIVDPLTRDRLSLRGGGLLSVRIPPKGDMVITGIYTVSSGQYNFSFQKFLKREFQITPGSQLVFAGNPMDARFDLQASYTTQASLYGLVKDQASSFNGSDERNLKKKEKVSVLLDMKGVLSNPALSFDIELPNQGNSPIGNAASQALNRLKVNETELNKQVFSLLLFNSFTGNSNTGNISTTGTSTAVRSVGNLINSQLSKLSSNVEGFQVNIDVDQYRNQFSSGNEQITEVDVGISQSLFNDKLNISVGGNVDLESGNNEEGILGNLAGDFVLEYKLDDQGMYTVRVFQKSDYDALNDSNLWKTGAGFSYQTSFGKILKRKK